MLHKDLYWVFIIYFVHATRSCLCCGWSRMLSVCTRCIERKSELLQCNYHRTMTPLIKNENCSECKSLTVPTTRKLEFNSKKAQRINEIPLSVLALLASQQATPPKCSQHSKGQHQHHNKLLLEEVLGDGTKG